MTKTLIALLDGKEAGRVVRNNHGKFVFTYDEQWRNADTAYPLSLSMPLALAEHPNAKVDPFLWGLLPDNEIVLGSWARKFHVSPRNAFSLIACVGEDCAGAVQFVQPERLDAIIGAAAPPIEWLDEAGIAGRLVPWPAKGPLASTLRSWPSVSAIFAASSFLFSKLARIAASRFLPFAEPSTTFSILCIHSGKVSFFRKARRCG